MNESRRLALRAVITAVAVSVGIEAMPPARAGGLEEERLRHLEEMVLRQSEELGRMRHEFDGYRRDNPEGGRPTDDELRTRVDRYLAGSAGATVAVASVTERGRGVRWGGYAQFIYEAPSNANSFFDLHRLVLKGDAAVTECLDLDFEIEFENGGVTDEVPGEVAIEQAELSFHLSDGFTPLIGGILIPFGRYNLHHDDPINDLTERPFTATYLMPTGYCQPGIGAQGAAPFGAGHAFQYKVAVTNGYKDDFNIDEGVRDARPPWDQDNNDAKQVWGRVAATWCVPGLSYLETGLSGTRSKYDDRGRNTLAGYGADFLARLGAFELSGEYLRQDYERNTDDPPGAVKGQWAWYVEGACHFFPNWCCGGNGCLRTDTSLFTLVVRYEEQDLDTGARGASFLDDLRALTIGLNYRLTERTVFRVDHTSFFAATADDEDRWTFSFSTFF